MHTTAGCSRQYTLPASSTACDATHALTAVSLTAGLEPSPEAAALPSLLTPADVWLLTDDGGVLPAHRCVLEVQSDLLGDALHEDAQERPAGEAMQLRIPQLARAQVLELLKAACSKRLSVHLETLAVPQVKALAEAASLLQCSELLSLADAKLAKTAAWCEEDKSLGTIPEYSQALDVHQWAHEQGLPSFETVSAEFVVMHLKEVAQHTSPGRAFLPVFKALAESPVAAGPHANLIRLVDEVLSISSLSTSERSAVVKVKDAVSALKPVVG